MSFLSLVNTQTFRDLLPSDVKHYIELLQVLVQRNLKVRYRGSILGIYWSLLNPLIMTSLYTVIFGATFAAYYQDSILNYVLAALTGLIIVNFFSASTSQALSSIVGNGALLNKIRLPVSVFPLSMIVANIFQFVMGAFPLLAIVALLKSHHLINVLAIFLPFIALIFFCTGVGFLVSSLYVFFRDLPYFYELVVFVLWISSPVFYPAEIVAPKIRPFLNINPLSIIIESLRQITLSGDFPDLNLMINALLGGILSSAFGWLYFRQMRSRFMDLL
ncbi:ABC-2 type transporter [[Leptolyngbya] sp. PCC 7376]|uniref:ABC transporter permease n=1 Tax=[Leptolyngbya] sp. PCC 7376 TaxID=111781 RepID=UPI00029F0E01|nr:ABC transporter permease [[Leptolyngbya] sp. PCC 7376]AFY36966.1 ABC-2 type transporter [[Leptolyngbya] sp. PCC 7376]